MANHDEACRMCEHWVTVGTKQYHTIRCNLLVYDKRKSKHSAKGLALQSYVPLLSLHKGDRLEPCLELPHVGAFQDLHTFPVRVLFWRVSDETLSHHRNPLFSEELGVTPTRTLALDWLHCLASGMFQTFCCFAVHMLLNADVWRTLATTETARNALSVQCLQTEWSQWLRAQMQAGIDPTELEVLWPEMFGTFAKPKFGLKGAETNYVLEFFLVLAVLPRFGDALGAMAETIFACWPIIAATT